MAPSRASLATRAAGISLEIRRESQWIVNLERDRAPVALVDEHRARLGRLEQDLERVREQIRGVN